MCSFESEQSVTPSPESVVTLPSPGSSPETTPNATSVKGPQRLVIVDWDDTLMPSSYLVDNIRVSTDANKKIVAFRLHPNLDTKAKSDEFKTNLNKTGQATLDLLSMLIREYGAANLRIVTNARRGWVAQSLCITGHFCPSFTRIRSLLRDNHIEIFYARDSGDTNLPSSQWKSRCIGNLLWAKLSRRASADIELKVTTIGDQWWDHNAVSDCIAYRVYGHAITKHQLKLLVAPQCHYLATELNYVRHVLENRLLNENEDVTLEFDGYTEDGEKEKEDEDKQKPEK